MAIFDLKDLRGKDFYAKETVTAYWGFNSNTNEQKKLMFTISPGLIGTLTGFKVFQPVGQTKADTWLAFPGKNPFSKDRLNQYFFIKYKDDIFDSEALKSQGAEDVKEKAQNKFVYYVERWGKPILILSGIGLAIKGYSLYAKSKQ